MKRLVLPLAIAALVVGACSDQPRQATVLPPGGGVSCQGVASKTLDELFPKYFAAGSPTSCAGCHATGAGGLSFASAHDLWLATVQVRSQKDPGMFLVAPRDPGHSYLYRKLLPSADGRMPQGGPYLDDAALTDLAGWICAGALEPASAPGPAITGFSPASGAPGTGVTLTGTGFSPVASDNAVTFNGTVAVVGAAASTFISTTVPAAATTGKIAVVVQGTKASSATDFQVTTGNPLPAISSISPISVLVGSGAASLTIDGSGFISASQLFIDGAALSSTFVSATRLSAIVSAAATATAGTHNFTISNPAPGGGTSAPKVFTVNNPSPMLTAINPSSVATGGAPFALSATGSGFVFGSQVSFNGGPVTTTFMDASTLQAQIPSIGAAGSYPVIVTNPSPGGGTSGSLSLVAATVSGPTLTGLSPSNAAENTAFTLTATGSGYVCGAASSQLLFGALAPIAAATCSATLLTAPIPATVKGAYNVQVKNPDGTLSNTVSFSVVAPNPAPVLSSLSPATALAGGSAFTLTVNGGSFVSGATLSFNGVSRAASFVSSLQVTAAIAASEISAAGSYPVTVTNPSPGGGSSAQLPFAVDNPLPSITSISPNTVVVNSGAFSLTVNGGGFVANATVVQIDGASRTTHFVSSAQVTADLLATDVGASGTHTVIAFNPPPGGGTSAGATLTVGALNPTPSIASLAPCGTVAGSAGFTLTVNGSGFIAGSTLTFNGIAVTPSSVAAGQISASIPSSLIATAPSITGPTPDAAPVVVTNPGPGGGPSNTAYFGVASAASTLSGSVQPIFTASCATVSCHVTGSRTAPMSLQPGQSYAALVGVLSSGCPTTLRVLACGPLRSQSVLSDKILATASSAPCSGSAMPKAAPLTQADLQRIVDWVAQGALNN